MSLTVVMLAVRVAGLAGMVVLVWLYYQKRYELCARRAVGMLAGVWLLLALATAAPAQTSAPPPLPASQTGRTFGTPVGEDATVTPTGGGVQITFQPASTPDAHWSAGEGRSWDWSATPTLAFDASNPGPDPVVFYLVVSDDPKGGGVVGSGSLGPSKSGSFFVDLSAVDSKKTMGMNAGPPPPGHAGMQAMAGSGEVNPARIAAFRVFMIHPPAPRTLRISNLRLLPSTPQADLYKGIVDAFGQFTRADWPGKVHAARDLTARRDQEARELAAAPAPPGRDEYGGWAAGPQLPASGFFTTTQRDGRWWLVTPSGHLFLSFGVDVINPSMVTIVHPRDKMFTWLPKSGDPLARFYGQDDHVLDSPYKSGKTFDFYAANLERKYGPAYQASWRRTALARLKSWGFNTVGNWSDESLGAAHQVPYTVTLHVDGSHRRLAPGSDFPGPMHDPFDPQFAADCDATVRDKTTRVKNDPWCLGYFVDNELSWSGGPVEGGRYGLAYGALGAKADQPAKGAFLAQLKGKYGTVDRLNAAWGTKLASWDDLNAPYKASETPNDAQKADMADFVHAFARRYFTVVRGALRKYDPNHLYLGCRFAWKTPEAEKAAAEVCDVVSFNIYRPRVDPKTWAWTRDLGKPCLVGEFHFGALDRGMFHPGLVSVPDQATRAAMYQDYIRSVVDNPAFVGAHWFEYADEPLTGRSLDGENYNIGFVTVTDTPYPEMVAAARVVHAEAYTRRAQASNAASR